MSFERRSRPHDDLDGWRRRTTEEHRPGAPLTAAGVAGLSYRQPYVRPESFSLATRGQSSRRLAGRFLKTGRPPDCAQAGGACVNAVAGSMRRSRAPDLPESRTPLAVANALIRAFPDQPTACANL